MVKPPYILFICLVVFLISCGDLQKPSSTSKCVDALNAQNYDLAINSCTSKKKGDAYMGKAGFTILNLINNSSGETMPSNIATTKASNALGNLDDTGAKILYILGFASTQDSDSDSRKAKITSSLSNFKKAISSYQGIIANDKNAALMYTYANVFSMQLNQSLNLDKNTVGSSQMKPCSSDISNNAVVKFDGYLFEYEQFKASCSKSFSQMCTDQSETISYIAKIADGISKSAVDTDKNSNTEIIEKSKTASCTLLKAINAASKLSDSTEPCDVSSC